MKKLKLNVEELRVDGFATGAAEPHKGTLIANFATLRCTNLCTEIDSCGQVCPQ
ncbi:MAG TPA: hypothetical protein VGC13_03130 [Longimicrobium sp.]|jgi:hypothetical protein|uniref:hypothetical protein n=1 Tax=Longimicrobium sp. TaxID=2029185 RepID=UPI002ED7A66B